MTKLEEKLNIYDYTKHPLICRFSNKCLVGCKNCKIIVNKKQYEILIGSGLYDSIFYKELERRNIKLEVK